MKARLINGRLAEFNLTWGDLKTHDPKTGEVNNVGCVGPDTLRSWLLNNVTQDERRRLIYLLM